MGGKGVTIRKKRKWCRKEMKIRWKSKKRKEETKKRLRRQRKTIKTFAPGCLYKRKITMLI